MLYTPSIPSIKAQAGSSGGVLPRNFTEHWSLWNPNPLEALRVDPPIHMARTSGYAGEFIGWRHTVEDGVISHWISRPEVYSLNSEWPPELKIRCLCYYLLDLMPNAALDEIVSALYDAIEFYALHSQPSSPLPVPQEIGEIAGIVERPLLTIDKD